MGSFLAGVKAGALAGLLFVGGMAVFNVALLYALKPAVLSSMSALNPTECPLTPVNGTSAQGCFASVIAVGVPVRALVGFFITLFYTGVFGVYYDALPGKSGFWKGEGIAVIVGANLIFFGFAGYVFDFASAALTTVFLLVWVPVFGYSAGRLYRRYTRAVAFASDDPGLLRIMVDGRDSTGSTRTLSSPSSHKIAAELANDASFKGWSAGGGVAVGDPRALVTVMHVSGDGEVKGAVGRKY